jgi:hypothetical protein
MKLAYVTSAYNETLNLEELHRRCRLAWQSLAEEIKSETGQKLGFRMVIADNQSSDDSLETLQRIIASDPDVIGVANGANYGPVCLEKFGFTVENVVAKAKALG